MDKYASLRLDNQLCLPLYAAAREVIGLYRAPLAPLGLTYTQYIVMMALWDRGAMNVKALGACLSLDNGTIVPVLKKLIERGMVKKWRGEADERVVMVALTEAGMAMREAALKVPACVGRAIGLSLEEAFELKRLLGKILKGLEGEDGCGKGI